MIRNELDQVCDALTSDALKARLVTVLQALAGLSAGDARRVLRFASNAVDELPVISPMADVGAAGQNDPLIMTEQAFVDTVRRRESNKSDEGMATLKDRVTTLERSLLYGSAYGLAFAKYNFSQPKSFQR